MRCPARSNNVYFANNEQASPAAFAAAFYFAHAENLTELKLYNNWSAQAVYDILESATWNLRKSIKSLNQPT